MPTQSVFPPVRFDDAAAAALFVALHHLADELVRARRVAEMHADLARADWSGYTRRWFERELTELTAAGRAASTQAAEEAEAVRSARAWASAENQRRAVEAQRANDAEVARLAALAAEPTAA